MLDREALGEICATYENSYQTCDSPMAGSHAPCAEAAGSTVGNLPRAILVGDQFAYLTGPNLRLSVAILFGVTLLLLIACVNIANLLLGRSLARASLKGADCLRRTTVRRAKPDTGSAMIFGLPVLDTHAAVQIRRRIGFVSEEKDLYPYMTVDQVIRFTRRFFPKWREDLAQRYLEMFELPANQKIPGLSKGMRSKLMLLLAISRGADLLILDEPTDGLDPATVEDVLRELVALAAGGGVTIFFSSHQLAEVERITDRVLIIDHGRTVVADSLDDLKARYRRLHIVLEKELCAPIQWADGVEHLRQDGRTISIMASRNVEELLQQARSIPGASVEQFPVTLQEIFLEHVRVH